MSMNSSRQRILTPIWTIALYTCLLSYLCTAVVADRLQDAMDHLEQIDDNIEEAAEEGDIDRLNNIDDGLDTMFDSFQSGFVDPSVGGPYGSLFIRIDSLRYKIKRQKSDPIVIARHKLNGIEKAIEKLSKECKAPEIDKLREELYATEEEDGKIRPFKVVLKIKEKINILEGKISELEGILQEEREQDDNDDNGDDYYDELVDDLENAQDDLEAQQALNDELVLRLKRLYDKAREAAKKCKLTKKHAMYNLMGGEDNAYALVNAQQDSITVGLQPNIERIDYNFCGEQKEAPNDPYFRARGSWGQTYDDQWAIKHVGFTAEKGSAWDIEDGTNNPIVVAVIDTGLDWNHKDIDWDNIWRNEDEIPDNGKDDDNNGYVDDIIGWNFIGNNNKPWDEGGHGTFVTGVIAAATNNNIGIAGINRGAKIMVLKALDAFGYTRVSFLAEAIFYAARNGARVINISAGGEHLTMTMQEAVDYAYDRGAVIVVAAGNEAEDTRDLFPVGLRNVIGVSTTDNNDKRMGFSNWGQNIDIAAPGMDVLSLRARRTDLMLGIPGIEYSARTAYVGEDTRYYRASGTSFSAPIVAATASLIFARDPTLTNTEVERMLLQSARDIEVAGWDQYTGFGLLDARAALMADPEYYLLSQIKKVQAVQEKDKVYLEVLGTADSNVFKMAWLDLGFGEEPKKWKKVAAIKEPVSQGRLGLIPTKEFKKPGKWTLRLQARDKKGKVRESRASIDIE